MHASGDVLVVAHSLLELEVGEFGELLEMLSEGFPTAALDRLLSSSGIPTEEAATYLRLSLAELAQRRSVARLSPEISERLLRLAELFAHAVEFFGEPAAASGWLISPAFGLSRKRPIDYAQTEWGAREVHNLIGRIADGVVA